MLIIFYIFTTLLCECTTVLFNQTLKQHYLSLKDLNLPSKALSITLRQLSPTTTSTLLTARKDFFPSTNSTTENWEIKADKYDFDDWVSKSRTHILQLNEYHDWRLGIYTYEFYTQIEWILTIEPLEESECINNCFFNGQCIQNQCVCNEGWVGLDCSIQINKGSLNKAYEIFLSSETYTYFSLDFNSSLSCQFTKESHSLYLFTKTLDSGISNVTGTLDYDRRINIAYGVDKKDCFIKKSSLLGIYSVLSQKISFKCIVYREKVSSMSPIIMWILIGVAVLIVFIWILLVLLRCCKFNKRPKIAPQYKVILKNDKFPVVCFKEMNKMDQETCPICQIKFEVQSSVRVLECGHFYHKDCIDEWFQTQKNCCICKKDYNHENYYENLQASGQTLLNPEVV